MRFCNPNSALRAQLLPISNEEKHSPKTRQNDETKTIWQAFTRYQLKYALLSPLTSATRMSKYWRKTLPYDATSEFWGIGQFYKGLIAHAERDQYGTANIRYHNGRTFHYIILPHHSFEKKKSQPFSTRYTEHLQSLFFCLRVVLVYSKEPDMKMWVFCFQNRQINCRK